ncbi:hypothetical protein BGZ93_005186 [Podila epicladia]|nr:hypothetical protein BGZ93_005186 [Podila epicladia]
MDLPEIRTHLAHFLNHKDTVACAMVCRDWHQSFVAYIWHTGCFDDETSKRRPPKSAMVKNGHFIRVMLMETVDRVKEYLQHCPNIEKIYFRFPSNALTRFKESNVDAHCMYTRDGEGDDSNAHQRAVEIENIRSQFWQPVTRLVLQSPKLTEMYFCVNSPTPSASFLERVSKQKAIIGPANGSNNDEQGDQHQQPEENLFSTNTYRTFKRAVFYRQMFDEAQSPWLTLFLSRCKEITLLETQHNQPLQPLTYVAPFPPPEEWSFPLTASLDLARIVGLSSLQQIHLLTRMPELKSLEFALEDSLPVFEIVDPFCAAISQHCPHLQVFSFTATPSRSLTEAQQVQVIEAPQMAIRKLCLEGFDFGLEPVVMPSSHLRIPAFDRLLDRFALSLTALDLNKCFRVSSKHTQRILTSCPNLKYCVLLGLHVSDILGLPRTDLPDQQGSEEGALTQTHGEGKDWVSLKLKGLSVYICGLKDAPPAVHAQVFARLARLTHLQRLNVGNSGGLRFNQVGWQRDGLDCRLRSGLGKLATLKEMQQFSMIGLRQELNVEDVEWMTQHWRGLQKVTGSLTSTNAGPLIETLKRAKVKVMGSWA